MAKIECYSEKKNIFQVTVLNSIKPKQSKQEKKPIRLSAMNMVTRESYLIGIDNFTTDKCWSYDQVYHHLIDL